MLGFLLLALDAWFVALTRSFLALGIGLLVFNSRFIAQRSLLAPGTRFIALT
ncbi:hypothetical protein MKY41_11725 [Sporosarcina sp. FSL W7-1349]|uniref:hypothetical protein n=1 Tax=Sporosarcina sp. FSL W7-1349 TaxID=2921561 RepID=UPI0030F74043